MKLSERKLSWVGGWMIRQMYLALNVCQGTLGQSHGRIATQPGQAFQSLGEELGTANRDANEGA